jgi:hypothetical protein
MISVLNDMLWNENEQPMLREVFTLLSIQSAICSYGFVKR